MQVTIQAAPILRGVDIEVGPGERVGLVGRNGAGKTTVMRSITGLATLAAGSIHGGGIPRLEIRPSWSPGLGSGLEIPDIEPWPRGGFGCLTSPRKSVSASLQLGHQIWAGRFDESAVADSSNGNAGRATRHPTVPSSFFSERSIGAKARVSGWIGSQIDFQVCLAQPAAGRQWPICSAQSFPSGCWASS